MTIFNLQINFNIKISKKSNYVLNTFNLFITNFWELFAVCVLFFGALTTCSTEQKTSKNNLSTTSISHSEDQTCIMFYNVENLFDYFDDPHKNDNEFLPKGSYYWTQKKYTQKIQNIYKVIAALGGWNPPDIIGLCEIENIKVLKDLCHSTPLVKYNYQIVHHESPDNRGIDVAMLYRKDRFNIISEKAFKIQFPESSSRHTRDILYVKGLIHNKDTLHVFVNHWPSRYGGMIKSEPKRLFVASVLKSKTDSLFIKHKDPKIIITGDFNDEPYNNSITKALSCINEIDNLKEEQLFNLSYAQHKSSETGTHKYRDSWGTLDQFIVSSALIDEEIEVKANVFQADFLLEEDEKYLGKKPKRTYIGRKYHGGFSDHLPIYLTILKK